jgi:decaprenyl-phosphate phosphoribosyltransferase
LTEQPQTIDREAPGGESSPRLEPVAERGRERSRSSSLPLALLRAARPKQWTKNVLLLAAPAAAGALAQPASLLLLALAFVSFCLVASGTYLLNDARDAEADRAHPKKRHRPVAAGIVPVGTAVATGIVLMALGFGVAYLVGVGFLGMVALYVATTIAYTLWLKHTAVIDIAVVASGFIIRAVAGGLAVGVPISRYFLIVASFGALFLVAGKRHGEHLDLGPERARTRATLSEYSREYLRFVWTMAAAVTIAAYCLWAFEQAGAGPVPWYELSIIPFVLFMLRYALLLGNGRGSAPEELVLGDRGLQLSALAWVLVYGAGIYLGG